MFSSQLVCGHQGGVPLDLGPLHFLDGLVGSEGSKGWFFFANDVIGHPNCSAPPLTTLRGRVPSPRNGRKERVEEREKARQSARQQGKDPEAHPSENKTVQALKQSQQHRQRGILDRRQPPPNFLSKQRLIAWADKHSLHFSTGSCIPSTLPTRKKGTFHPVSWLHWVGSSLARR